MLRALARLFARHDGDPGPVKVIVGLGNPGKEYERTRHNVGWWVVDHLADVWRLDGWRRDGDARVVGGQVDGATVRLVKPQTYMNLSGAVLRPYLRRAGWAPQHDLLIVLDEAALPLGSFRFRARGSSAGHNGLKSIEGALGHQDYARLRIGIGPPPGRHRGDLADYVLSEFGKGDAKVVNELMPSFVEAIESWIKEGIEPVMNRFNRKVTSEDAP
ncbi:MAG TPA: aminoacyl-tRNA hydrolase [Gemmatimonadaceae bacterium]|nr:aminoacyl-tRNA hydrolase [Gemmatimonadaceae bacterium]